MAFKLTNSPYPKKGKKNKKKKGGDGEPIMDPASHVRPQQGNDTLWWTVKQNKGLRPEDRSSDQSEFARSLLPRALIVLVLSCFCFYEP